MNRSGALLAVLPLVAIASGCVYLNGVYNAERAYADAEKASTEGRDSAALEAYGRAAEKARRAYARDPDGKWADDALYLVGRARMRRGEWEDARDALEQVRERATDRRLQLGATLYLGAIAVITREDQRAQPLLDRALAELPPGFLLGEGHLWRARNLLAQGLVGQGWWDLDRAVEQDARLRIPAALERLTWGVVQGDHARAAEGAMALLLDPQGAGWADTVVALVGTEEARHGAAGAAALLDAAEDAPWPGPTRDRMVLLRAALHVRAGDTVAAVTAATEVAAGVGEGAIAARLFLAHQLLSGIDRPEAVDRIRPVLLPVISDADVVRLLEASRQLQLLVERGRSQDPLGLFAAAEVARDQLEAHALATALFLEYAELTPPAPWRGKALLAAVALAPDPRTAVLLRRRADRLEKDPYVAVAKGVPGDPGAYEALENELRDRLAGLLAQVTGQARIRALPDRGDSAPSEGS